MAYKVLIVDDIEKNLQLVGNLLQEKGVNIMLADNGKKALVAAKKKIPDLILLDIAMPEMDGYEVCKQLKNNELTKKIPIIFLTAKNESEDVVKGFAYGAVDYVTKPFNKAELTSRVFTHLELKKSRDIIAEQNEELCAQNIRIMEHSTQMENLNTKLNQQNEQLKEVNATKDKFFSIISHDLKGPLSSIMTVAQLLVEDFDKYDIEHVHKMISTLKSSTDNTYKLLNNLLDWARTQTGKLTFNPEKIDLYDMVRTNLELLAQPAWEKNVKTQSYNFEEVYVHADKSMTNTIIRNLMSNAIKFTRTGGTIEISCNTNDENKLALITIKDSGIGIEQEQLDKLFDLTVNTSRKGTSGEPGTGLGLILCKEFVEINGGEIRVESEVNKGSNFTFSLPLYER